MPGSDVTVTATFRRKDKDTPATHRVTLTGGANATASGGATTQVVEEGDAVQAVTYAPKACYHFEKFDAFVRNGVSVELRDGKVVVSGKPTADVEIPVPDAVPDPAPTPAKRRSSSSSKSHSPKVVRLAGEDRYATMSAILGEGFESSAWAVLASGANYPDALAASGLAGAYGAPVVLTASGALSPEARAELERLGVTSAIVMGGTSSVSEAVEAELAGMGVATMRVAGEDRLATSVEAMRRLRSADGVSDTVVIATGYSFADALSMGPWCWATCSPVVLAGEDGLLSGEAVEAILADGGLTRVVVAGGDASVSAAVAEQLGLDVTRLAGEDRYATSRVVAEWSVANGLDYRYATVATGRSFPDALAGAALAGRNASVLVVADKASDPTVGLLRSHRSEIEKAYVLGGASSVPDEVLDAIA